jgi:hypothetical protein
MELGQVVGYLNCQLLYEMHVFFVNYLIISNAEGSALNMSDHDEDTKIKNAKKKK